MELVGIGGHFIIALENGNGVGFHLAGKCLPFVADEQVLVYG